MAGHGMLSRRHGGCSHRATLYLGASLFPSLDEFTREEPSRNIIGNFQKFSRGISGSSDSQNLSKIRGIFPTFWKLWRTQFSESLGSFQCSLQVGFFSEFSESIASFQNRPKIEQNFFKDFLKPRELPMFARSYQNLFRIFSEYFRNIESFQNPSGIK